MACRGQLSVQRSNGLTVCPTEFDWMLWTVSCWPHRNRCADLFRFFAWILRVSVWRFAKRTNARHIAISTTINKTLDERASSSFVVFIIIIREGGREGERKQLQQQQQSTSKPTDNDLPRRRLAAGIAGSRSSACGTSDRRRFNESVWNFGSCRQEHFWKDERPPRAPRRCFP